MDFRQMDNEIDNKKRQIPVIKNLKCKILTYLIAYGLNLFPIFIFVYVWIKYDFLVGVGMGLCGYIISVVIASKLRLSSIPLNQIEVSHSNLEIAKWYIFMHCN